MSSHDQEVFFVKEPYWKTHRIVDAELDKLEITPDVNDNDKSEFSKSDGNDEQVFYKVAISISCYSFFISRILIQNTSLHNFIRPLVKKIFITAFYY